MYRVAIIFNGETEHKDLPTIELCYEYLLSKEYNKYLILELETKDIIERG